VSLVGNTVIDALPHASRGHGGLRPGAPGPANWPEFDWATKQELRAGRDPAAKAAASGWRGETCRAAHCGGFQELTCR